MENLIIECLKNEVKPATGCTEPVAIALAAAYAARAIDRPSDIEKIKLEVSTNILKNAMNVGVPRTKRMGLEVAVALGAYGDAQAGMNVLNKLSESQVQDAHDLHDLIPIEVRRSNEASCIYIACTITCQGLEHKAVISGKHDKLVYYSVDGMIYYQDESDFGKQVIGYESLFSHKLETLLQTIGQMKSSTLDFMMDGYIMNKAIAEFGMKEGPGLGLGKSLGKGVSKELTAEDLVNFSMQLTASASDARMSGVDMPVMTSNGSGNNGLTAVLPIVAADIIYNFDDDQVVKALAMSHIINSYIKYYLGRLSSVCACGVASGTGAAIGIGYLLGIEISKLPCIVDTMVANLSGMVCDGAKLGCALKLSTATAAAIQSVYMLQENGYADAKNGIVGLSPEESVINLADLANKGMKEADNTITDILMSKYS